jgi:hypothetical protein
VSGGSDWTPPRRDPYVDLADESAHQAAVRERAAERELRQRATELAGWSGTLRDLAEAGTAVTVRCRSGRVHHGVLLAVAEDFVALRLPGGQLVALAGQAVTSVRPEPGSRAAPAMGDRDRAQDRTLLEVLDRAVAERRRLALSLDGSPEVLQGVLAAVGEDVVTLRLDGRDRDVVYVRAGAILEVVVEPA